MFSCPYLFFKNQKQICGSANLSHHSRHCWSTCPMSLSFLWRWSRNAWWRSSNLPMTSSWAFQRGPRLFTWKNIFKVRMVVYLCICHLWVWTDFLARLPEGRAGQRDSALAREKVLFLGKCRHVYQEKRKKYFQFTLCICASLCIVAFSSPLSAPSARQERTKSSQRTRVPSS